VDFPCGYEPGRRRHDWRCWLWLKWLYFYPGDFILGALSALAPEVGKFFEFSPEIYGGVLSGVISGVAWIAAVLLAVAALAALTDPLERVLLKGPRDHEETRRTLGYDSSQSSERRQDGQPRKSSVINGCSSPVERCVPTRDSRVQSSDRARRELGWTNLSCCLT
jgi:hypothetical protein